MFTPRHTARAVCGLKFVQAGPPVLILGHTARTVCGLKSTELFDIY